MGSLMIGISGVRGIVGESLTPQLLMRLGEAYGTYFNSGRVVVGRDTRLSGEMVKHSVFGGLLSSGCSIIDVGVCTTPSCTLMIDELKADGGIVISASHNPVEWNALKFFRGDGIYLNEREARMLLDIYYQGDFVQARWDGFKDVIQVGTTNEIHVKRVLKLIDAEEIRKAKFRVALDCCNGAGVDVSLKLLDELGCTVEKINCRPDGNFPRDPEPTFVNLGDICSLAEKKDVDVGFAQDADADRLAVISEKGAFLGEEYSLGIAVEYLLQKQKGPVVINMSTSRLINDLAARQDCETVKVPVGEVNVAEKMQELKSPIGGEGNGGIIDPRLHYGRDSLIAIALVLEYMAKSGKKPGELVATMPKYYMAKEKVDCPRNIAYNVLQRIKGSAEEGNIDTSDGIRIDWEDSWVHIRPSNTEPVLRIISESTTKEMAENLNNRYRSLAIKALDA